RRPDRLDLGIVQEDPMRDRRPVAEQAFTGEPFDRANPIELQVVLRIGAGLGTVCVPARAELTRQFHGPADQILIAVADGLGRGRGGRAWTHARVMSSSSLAE